MDSSPNVLLTEVFRTQLINHLSIDPSLLAALVQSSIISSEEHEKILTDASNPDKTQRLLRIIHNHPSNVVSQFVLALKNSDNATNTQLADYIEGTSNIPEYGKEHRLIKKYYRKLVQDIDPSAMIPYLRYIPPNVKENIMGICARGDSDLARCMLLNLTLRTLEPQWFDQFLAALEQTGQANVARDLRADFEKEEAPDAMEIQTEPAIGQPRSPDDLNLAALSLEDMRMDINSPMEIRTSGTSMSGIHHSNHSQQERRSQSMGPPTSTCQKWSLSSSKCSTPQFPRSPFETPDPERSIRKAPDAVEIEQARSHDLNLAALSMARNSSIETKASGTSMSGIHHSNHHSQQERCSQSMGPPTSTPQERSRSSTKHPRPGPSRESSRSPKRQRTNEKKTEKKRKRSRSNQRGEHTTIIQQKFYTTNINTINVIDSQNVQAMVGGEGNTMNNGDRRNDPSPTPGREADLQQGRQSAGEDEPDRAKVPRYDDDVGDMYGTPLDNGHKPQDSTKSNVPVTNRPVLYEDQLELAENAVMEMNTVLVAPTGSGKTHVAAYIIHDHFITDRPKPVVERRALFLVTTVDRVGKKQEKLKDLLKPAEFFSVIGASELPLKEEVTNGNVIVLTAQLLENALDQIPLERFSLLVFDECHLCQKGHAYNTIMARYLEEKLKGNPNLPQIVGMTASLGTGKAKRQDDANNLAVQICANMDASCISMAERNKKALEERVNIPEEGCARKQGESKGAARDAANRQREVMMMEAAKHLKEKTPGQFVCAMQRQQEDDRLERQARQEQKREIRRDNGGTTFAFHCNNVNCNAFALYSHHVGVYVGSQYLILDPDFKSRIDIKKRQKPKKLHGDITIIGKMVCKKCQYDWGALTRIQGFYYLSAGMGQLHLRNLTTGEPTPCKQWKDVPFEVEKVTVPPPEARVKVPENVLDWEAIYLSIPHIRYSI